MTIREFKTWLSVLAAAGAEIPAALALRRLEETVEEAGGQTDNDPLLDEVLALIRKAVSSNTDERAGSSDLEAQPRSPCLGPHHRFDFVVDSVPEVTYSDRHLMILRYPYGRVEALDRARGACMTLRCGELFPGQGQVGQTAAVNQNEVALKLIGDDPRAVIFVRQSITDVEQHPFEVQREILLSDHRAWTIHARKNDCVSNLGEGRLWLGADGRMRSGFDALDTGDSTDEPLRGAIC